MADGIEIPLIKDVYPIADTNFLTGSQSTFRLTKDKVTSAVTQTRISKKFIQQSIITAILSMDKKKAYCITKLNYLVEFDIIEQKVKRKLLIGKLELTCLSISENQQFIIIGDFRGGLYKVDVESFTLMFNLLFEKNVAIKGIAVSPDGEYGQVLISTGDIAKINFEKNGKRGDFKMKGRNYLVMRPDGNFFAGSENLIRLCDLGLGTIKDYMARSDVVMIFLTDKYIIAQQENKCEILDIESTATLYDVILQDQISYITMTDDGKLLFAASVLGKVNIIDLDFHNREIIFDMNNRAINFIYFFPEESKFGTFGLDSRTSIAAFPIFRDKPVVSFKTTSQNFVFINKDELAYSQKNTICVYNFVSKTSSVLYKQKQLSSCFLFVPPYHIISACESNLITFNIESKIVCTFSHDKAIYADQILINPSKTLLAVITKNKSIIVFDATIFKFVNEFISNADINVGVFVNDKIFASGSSHLVLWDTDTGKPLANLKGHKFQLRGLAVKNELLFSSGENNQISVWN